MLNISTENTIILDFLQKYPEKSRSSCVEAILLYGIRTLKTKFPYGLTAPQLLSVSGLPYESHDRKSSSLSQWISHNKSVDLSRMINEIKINDDKTERFREHKADEHTKRARPAQERSFKVSSGIKEPVTASFETAKGFIDRTGPEKVDRESEVMKIADDFLKNSYAAYLSNGLR